MAAANKPDIFEERKRQWEQGSGSWEAIILNQIQSDLEKARTDKNHPLRKCVLMLDGGDFDGCKKELLKSNSKLGEGIRFLATLEAANAELQKADEEAEKLINLTAHSDLEDFAKLPPVSGLTLLAVMAKIDEKTIESAGALFSKRQSRIGKKPRPRRQHKGREIVADYWRRWQAAPNLYPSKAAFIRDMMEKTEINRPQTIQGWIKLLTANRLAAPA